MNTLMNIPLCKSQSQIDAYRSECCQKDIPWLNVRVSGKLATIHLDMHDAVTMRRLSDDQLLAIESVIVNATSEDNWRVISDISCEARKIPIEHAQGVANEIYRIAVS